ncbi:hypothetical protein [Pedobacter frigiditerrae]|uniref:hypothetical protein n=1 Tax=Pedobacter frigiditerrae TaxID=2530452 RepID=UPI00292F1766|nr:hypothetical protein [Pedobacter frigiditerrae]
MLVQLDEKSKDRGAIKKKDIKKMVKYHRGGVALSKKLKYAHFRLEDILDLFVKNGVLHSKIIDLLENDLDVQQHNKDYGVKIYLGKHKELKTCPPNGRLKPEEYLKKTTTIICNTDLANSAISSVNFKGFKDMLEDHKCLLIASARPKSPTDPGDGLDQAEICPPFPNNDEEIYDIGSDS